MITEQGRLTEDELTPEVVDSIAQREKHLQELEQQMTELQTTYIAMKDHLKQYVDFQKRSENATGDPGQYLLKDQAITSWTIHCELTRLFFIKASDLSVDMNDLQMKGHPFGF